MIKVQLIRSAALHTLSAIALPDFEFDMRRNDSTSFCFVCVATLIDGAVITLFDGIDRCGSAQSRWAAIG